MVKFCSLGSGSDGNCSFIGTKHSKILIDAGLSGIKIIKNLNEIGVEAKDLDGIFITHEHSDHTKGAGILSRKFDLPIYATYGTWSVMRNSIGEINSKNLNYIYNDEHCFINDVCINPFYIPHDAIEPVGFNILAKNYKISIATDIGHINEDLKESIVNSDILLIEANYDKEMINLSSYPYDVKKRIIGKFGHLSNNETGSLLKDIITGKMKYIFLGHLSQDNNSPNLAYNTVLEVLKKEKIKIGKYIKMDICSRNISSNLVILD